MHNFAAALRFFSVQLTKNSLDNCKNFSYNKTVVKSRTPRQGLGRGDGDRAEGKKRISEAGP